MIEHTPCLYGRECLLTVSGRNYVRKAEEGREEQNGEPHGWREVTRVAVTRDIPPRLVRVAPRLKPAEWQRRCSEFYKHDRIGSGGTPPSRRAGAAHQ